MSMGVLAGTLDSTQIGTSLVGGYSYAAGQVINDLIAAGTLDLMYYFNYLVIPLVDFSPTTVMTLPTVTVTKESGGVRVKASGGNVPAQILIFGR